jgi:hypothetical protein
MKKYLLGVIIGIMVLIPFKVKAASYTYDVCNDSSCTYHDIDSVITKINDTEMSSSDTYTINVGKGTFDYANSVDEYILSNDANLIIKGIDANSSKINILDYMNVVNFNKVEVSNITFIGNSINSRSMEFFSNLEVNFNNVNFIDFTSSTDYSAILSFENNKEINLTKININNSNTYYGILFSNSSDTYVSKSILEKVNIIGTKEGIMIYRNYCNSASNSGLEQLEALTKMQFSAPSVTYQSGYNNIKINNSTIKSSICSVVMHYGYGCYVKVKSTATSLAFIPNNIDTNSTDYTSISNSSFSCLNANQTGTTTEIDPIIYADYTNTWLETPTRDVNVLETGTGKVYYDLLTKKDVSIMVHNNSNLADVIPSSELANITYEVEDETVARIVDNKVVGLRTGTTKVIARSGLNVYQFSVSVISNPTTDTALTVFVMLFVLVVLATVVTYTLKLENKIN